MTATRYGSTSRPTSTPASANAPSAARRAITIERSTTRDSGPGSTLAGSMSGLNAATSTTPSTGCPSGGLRRPERPSQTASNTSAAELPTGLTNPIPVTVTPARTRVPPARPRRRSGRTDDNSGPDSTGPGQPAGRRAA